MGRTIQGQLAGLNVFLVGAGALGCEFLKVWCSHRQTTLHEKDKLLCSHKT